MHEDVSTALRVGLRIRHIRTGAGLTLRALSERSGLAHSQLSLVENGHRELRPSLLERVAHALDVPVEELLRPDPPSERARLELELDRLQRSPIARGIGIQPIDARRSLPDDALRTIVALHEELSRRTRESSATPEAARRAMVELRLEGQRVDNYRDGIEDRAAELMASMERPAGPLTHHTVARLAEHLGFELVFVDDLPLATRSVTDLQHGRIYLPPASTPGGHGLRSLALQAMAHRLLEHREPVDYADFLRQRIEITTFAAACLIPRDTAVPFLRRAKQHRDIALEDLRDAYGVTHETAAHRFTSLATRFLDIPVHFLRVRRSGAIVKGYENDGIDLPTDAVGGIVGQVVCAKYAARTAFADRNRTREHYQYTDTPRGTYWCSAQIGAGAEDFSITLGTPFAHAKWFRGRETTNRRSSTCPDATCCRDADPELAARWHDRAWPSARLGEHVLAPLPTGRFPGVDDGEVYRFLESHAAP